MFLKWKISHFPLNIFERTIFIDKICIYIYITSKSFTRSARKIRNSVFTYKSSNELTWKSLYRKSVRGQNIKCTTYIFTRPKQFKLTKHIYIQTAKIREPDSIGPISVFRSKIEFAFPNQSVWLNWERSARLKKNYLAESIHKTQFGASCDYVTYPHIY